MWIRRRLEKISWRDKTRCGAQHSVRAALYCHLANATDLLTPVLRSSELSPVGGSKLRSYFSPFVYQSSPITRLRQQTREFATPFSDCRYLVQFRRYSRSKCEVVRNRAEKTCFRPPFFEGRTPKFCTISDHMAKFRGDRLRDRDLALKKKERKKRNN